VQAKFAYQAWSSGLSGKAPAFQLQSPELKPQYHQKKKEYPEEKKVNMNLGLYLTAHAKMNSKWIINLSVIAGTLKFPKANLCL
jgi:hypothetical protein